MRRWWAGLGLIVFGIALALVVSEIGVRVWFSTRGSEQDRIRYLDDRATIDAKIAQLVGVPYLNYSLNPAFEDVNARGIRGRLVAVPKPEGVYRIVVLGGSTTYGHGLTADEAFPAQLERSLREDYGYANVEVVNLGAPGYYSLDSLVALETRGLALQPDLILDYDNLNDAIIRIFQDPACYSGDTPLFGMGMDRGVWQNAGDDLPASALYRLLAISLGWMRDPSVYTDRLAHTGFCPPEPQGVNPLDTLASNPPVYFERNLRSIAAVAGSVDAQVVFSTFAWDSAAAQAQLDADPTLTQAQAMLTAIDEHNQLVRQLAGELDAGLIDLAAEMGEGAYYQGDQVHMNADGARRQAEVYAAWLDESGMIAP